ncbi:MAG: MsnO8 family LLM class oxidoreductase [Acidimicrobiales bacterium]
MLVGVTTPKPLALSILDLAIIGSNESASDAFRASVATAQRAEQRGYERVWYAEHHNMASIASSATSVLIAHVAANTSTIRLGAGGIMLPNHSPLAIAEQFGTLATLHPGRIDLGLGRAPGSDQLTMRAMRVDPRTAERFPEDVRELQGYLSDESLVPGSLPSPAPTPTSRSTFLVRRCSGPDWQRRSVSLRLRLALRSGPVARRCRSLSRRSSDPRSISPNPT